MKKKLAIVLCSTSNMTFAIATTIINFKKTYKGSDYEFIVFTDGKFKEKDKKLINNVHKTIFINYDFPLKNKLDSKTAGTKHFTYMVFSKFECLKLLNEYETVIYTDYDVYITGDLSELENKSEFGIKALISEGAISNNLINKIDEYNMNGDSMLGGLIVFQSNLKNYNELYDFCYNTTLKYFDNLYFPEQVALSLMLQKFDIKPEKLNVNKYCLLPNNYPNFPDAKILHSYGFHKFWNGIKDDSLKLWNENYNEWIHMGGSKYKNTNKIFYKLMLKISWFIPKREWRDNFRLKFM